LHISNGRYGLTSSCGGADVDHSASIRRAVEKERAMIVRAKAPNRSQGARVNGRLAPLFSRIT